MFRELFDIAPDAMIAVDGEGRIVRANPQAARLFGYAEGELQSASIEALIPQRARTTHKKHLSHYAANPRIRTMGTGQELVGLRRDGTEFPVEIALSPISTADGQLYVAAIRDISESQRARQALIRARHDNVMAQIGQLMLAAPNLDVAVEDVPELIAAALDVPGVVLVLKNMPHERMRIRTSFGVPADVLDTLLESLPFDAPEWVPSHGRPTLLDLSPSVSSKEAGTAFDDAGFVSATMVPLLDPEKPMGALLVLSQDSRSFDHDAVHFMRSVSDMLASVIQRIRTEERLSHAQRLEAIGQLTGGIAHDFNNLLTIISGNLQILEEDLGDDPGARKNISGALRAVARGAELTRKLLAFARRQQLSPRACDPNSLLQELGVMLRRTLGDSVDLQTVCTPDMPHIFVDPGQLDAALVNLAINARDAMPRGGRLTITASMHEEPLVGSGAEHKHMPCVVLAVRDTGLGMAPDVLAHALEPFFTTKEQNKGTGLGLSMVYGFVKQSGGHLTIDSKLGYGTSIELHLPAIAPSPNSSERRDEETNGHGSETILVVEDEADVRGIAVTFLRRLGYQALAVANAEDALQLIVAKPEISLVFSDVMLGSGMTGMELLHEIGRIRPGLRVLLTSGDERSVYGSSVSEGSIAFELLRKPYRREDLSIAVRRLLDSP